MTGSSKLDLASSLRERRGEDGAPPEPVSRLDPAVRWQWALHIAGQAVIATVVGVMLSAPLHGTVATLAWSLPLAFGLAAVAVVPRVRYGRWRWEVRDEEIDLRHGTFAVTRTLVPMRRVQHVDSTAGVLEQSLGLSTVTIHTAGGAIEIPGLARARAWELHQRIAGLARLTEG